MREKFIDAEANEQLQQRSFLNLLIDIMIFVLIFCLVLLFFRFYQFPTIAGESMSPTFHDGDRVFAHVTKQVDVGDVVVVWSTDMNEYLVKRVIGKSGDHIRIDHGRIYRNETQIYEDYIAEQDWGGELTDVYDVLVPDGYLFLLGDNRNSSTDSRVLGMISCEYVRMKVIFRME